MDVIASAFVFDPNYFDSLVAEVTDYQLVDRSSIADSVNEISLRHRIQTLYGSHSVSHVMCNRSFLSKYIKGS